jgi:hypothetical protein
MPVRCRQYGLSGACSGDPAIDALFENGQRHADPEQNLVVEGFHIEFCAQFALGPLPQFADFEFTEFVRQGLTSIESRK